MREQGLAVSTAQNRISTINVVMGHAREGRWETVSPREVVGEARSQVRTEAPATLCRGTYMAAVDALRAAGLERSAAVLGLARELGMRSEEASKADLPRLMREADTRGNVNIQDGTKGGRDAPRWVPMTDAGRAALQAAMAARPDGSPNLLAPGETYRAWREGELRSGREILHEHGVRGYHDARAAYACEPPRAISTVPPARPSPTSSATAVPMSAGPTWGRRHERRAATPAACPAGYARRHRSAHRARRGHAAPDRAAVPHQPTRAVAREARPVVPRARARRKIACHAVCLLPLRSSDRCCARALAGVGAASPRSVDAPYGRCAPPRPRGRGPTAEARTSRRCAAIDSHSGQVCVSGAVEAMARAGGGVLPRFWRLLRVSAGPAGSSSSAERCRVSRSCRIVSHNAHVGAHRSARAISAASKGVTATRAPPAWREIARQDPALSSA